MDPGRVNEISWLDLVPGTLVLHRVDGMCLVQLLVGIRDLGGSLGLELTVFANVTGLTVSRVDRGSRFQLSGGQLEGDVRVAWRVLVP